MLTAVSQCTIGSAAAPGGRLDCFVEGLSCGSVTISAAFTDSAGRVIARDAVLFTVTNTLATPPFSLLHLEQHKDTRMVCLKCDASADPNENGHWWNTDHSARCATCDHCNYYCARASIAMVNRFFRNVAGREGGVSQDRISYHSRSAFTGATDYLGHRQGLSPMQTFSGGEPPPLPWALGLGASDIDQVSGAGDAPDFNAVWAFVCEAVLTFRPVVICFNTELYAPGGSNHAVVVGGVDLVDNGGTVERRVHLFDPWRQAAAWVTFPTGLGETTGFSYPNIYLALAVRDDKWDAAVNGARVDEASIGEDGDGDDVVTFDEDNPPDRPSPPKRFPSVPGGLNWSLPDTDGDDVRDDVEIQTTYGVQVLPAP